MRKIKAKYLDDTVITKAEASGKITEIIKMSGIEDKKISKLTSIPELLDLVNSGIDDPFIIGMKMIELNDSIFGLGETKKMDFDVIASHPSYNFKYLFNNNDIYVYYWNKAEIKRNKK